MKTYEICYSWYDEYSNYMFTNNHNYSQEQFEQDTSNAMKRAVDVLVGEDSYLGVNPILDLTLKILESDYGYVRYHADCHILIEGDFYPVRESKELDNPMLTKLLGSEYVDKIMAKMVERELEMERRYKEKYDTN